MRLRAARLRAYCLPLRQPWRSAAGVWRWREGWIVELPGEGLTGYGDCAPLPGSDTAAARAWLAQSLAQAPGRDAADWLEALPPPESVPPAARCALETALSDLLAREAGLPLASWLEPEAPLVLPVNAVMGALADEGCKARADAAVADGFRVLKLKAGLAPVAQELRRLRELAARLPGGVRLRIDANRAWGWEEAVCFLEGLDGLPVESVEEPLHAPSLDGLARLQGIAPCALAVDESLPDLGAARLLESKAVRRLVLKPTLLGGLRPALELARAAHRRGMECVVTTVLESAAGVWAAAHLAAASRSGLAHGLATGAWLAEDLGPGPCIRSGALHLGPGHGTGFQSDEPKIHR